MSDTSLQTTLPPPPTGGPGGVTDKPIDASKEWRKSPLFRALWAIASLRLTVILFVLSLILVFFGTMAQIDRGIWSVVSDYFRSFLVWIPFQLMFDFGKVFFWVPKSTTVPGAFPFPGGWTLGILLLVNLIAAHIVRFKISWKRSGILLIHAGLIVLLLGELITGLFAVEGTMTIDEGKSSNFVEEHRYAELAIVRPSATETDTDDVTVVPDRFLRKKNLVELDDLPFDIQPMQYMNNSTLESVERGEDNSATKGLGLRFKAIEKREVAGADTEQKVDLPSCYVQILDKAGRDRGIYMFSLMTEFLPGVPTTQPITIDGKTYQVSLRFKRTYKPYKIELIKFTHKKYMGTTTPKDFASLVRVIDPETGENRQVLIRMNEPLRYKGDALFQHSFRRTETTTILQVVTNPGWIMPYLSCSIVSIGLIVHFVIALVPFVRKRTAS